MTDRIKPTAEDLEIARRNVRRLLRWDAARRKTMTPEEVLEEGTRFVGVVRRMTGDYLEFKPKAPTWRDPIWYGKWRIYISDNGMFNYAYVHDDYDGADDSNDGRCGYGKSVDDCKREIDLYEEEHA